MPRLSEWSNQDEFRAYMHTVAIETVMVLVVLAVIACVAVTWWPR